MEIAYGYCLTCKQGRMVPDGAGRCKDCGGETRPYNFMRPMQVDERRVQELGMTRADVLAICNGG